MKIIEIKCPHCNGKLDFDMDKGTCICPYCGSSLYFDNENRTITHVTVVRDEARLKEAENARRKIEAEYEYRNKEYRRSAASGVVRTVFKVIKFLAIAWLVLFVVLFGAYAFMYLTGRPML